VNPDGLLTIDIESDLSALSDWDEKNEPVIDRRTLRSQMRLNRGQATIVVGLGRGLKLDLRNKKARDFDNASNAGTETILIATAETMEPRKSEKPEPTAVRK
jgi:hypothetical protein